MRNPLVQAALALIANASVGVKSLSIIVFSSYFLSFSENAIWALSVTPGQFWPPNFWLWTAITHCFLEGTYVVHTSRICDCLARIGCQFSDFSSLVGSNSRHNHHRTGKFCHFDHNAIVCTDMIFFLFLTGRQTYRASLGIFRNDQVLCDSQHWRCNGRGCILLFPLHANV